MGHSKLYVQVTIEDNSSLSVDKNITYEQVVYNLSCGISEPSEHVLSLPDRLRHHIIAGLDKMTTHILEVNDGSVQEISRHLFIASVTEKVYDKFN